MKNNLFLFILLALFCTATPIELFAAQQPQTNHPHIESFDDDDIDDNNDYEESDDEDEYDYEEEEEEEEEKTSMLEQIQGAIDFIKIDPKNHLPIVIKGAFAAAKKNKYVRGGTAAAGLIALLLIIRAIKNRK
jgi:hypothetical protein